MADDSDPILYRIMDFFEFVALANSGMLRVSSASRFSDVNELVGAFLAILSEPTFHPYTKDGMVKAIADYQSSKQQYFISSWSQDRDNIAMWELYSPSVSSVQIGVRTSVLKAYFTAYTDERSYIKGHGAEANDGKALFYPVEAGSCEYVQFEEMLEKLRDSYAALTTERDANLNDKLAFMELYSAFRKDNAIDVMKALFFKDRAYRYEEEYRFALRAVTRNSRPYEECQKDPFFVLFDSHLRPVRKEDIGENIFVPFDIKSIDEVWLDGRTPLWKQKVQGTLLEAFGLRSQLSKAYGSFFDQRSIDPMI